MRDIGLLDTKRGRTDETLEFGRFPGKVLKSPQGISPNAILAEKGRRTHLSDKGSLGDHALPSLALALSGLEDLEHLVLGDTSDLGERDGKLAGLFLALLLDRRRERLGVVLALAVEQVGRQGTLGEGRRVLGLDVALLVSLDRLLHGDLFGVPASVHHLGLVAVQGLCHLRLLVHLTGGALALALLVVELPTISLRLVIKLAAMTLVGNGGVRRRAEEAMKVMVNALGSTLRCTRSGA